MEWQHSSYPRPYPKDTRLHTNHLLSQRRAVAMSSALSIGLAQSAPSVHRLRGSPVKRVCESNGRARRRKGVGIVCAVGDVSSDGTVYLIAGAAAVALVGTAFPFFFSRKDLCPECDGAGFIRKSSSTLRANAARKDQAQIVCPNCNGLGKLGQIDK